jgi:hypothetical protein
MIYCEPGKYMCFGYDFKFAYPRCHSLPGFHLAEVVGREVHLKKLPKVLEYGIYRCRVICDHPDIGKIFMFSTSHHYTHYDLEFIRDPELVGFPKLPRSRSRRPR